MAPHVRWGGIGLFRRLPDDPEEFRQSFVEHLEELRRRLVRILTYIALGAIVGWFLQPLVYSGLTDFIRPLIPPTIDYREPFRSITEPFLLKLKLSLAIGLFLVIPLTVLELWGFVAPGLKPVERRALIVVAPLSVGLFALGTALCWMILPAAFRWFLSFVAEFPDTAVYQEPGTLVFFIIKMMIAFGLGFQLPLVVFFLARIGLFGPSALLQYWRQAVVLIFFVSASITPSGDIFSLLMLAVPLTLLYGLSILAVLISERRRPRDPVLDDLD